MYPLFTWSTWSTSRSCSWDIIQLIIIQDLEEGSCSSDAYTESEDDDVDKEYSTDNDINDDDDGSYDSGEDDIEEDLDYSDDSEHDSKINTNVKDGKVLHWSLYRLIP